MSVGQRRRDSESVAPESAADGSPAGCCDDGSLDRDVDSGDDHVRQPAATDVGQGGAAAAQCCSSQSQQQEVVTDASAPRHVSKRWCAADPSLAPRSSPSPSRQRSHSKTCDVTGVWVHSSSPTGEVGAGCAQPVVVAPHVATTGEGKESERGSIRRFSRAVTFNRHVHADGTVTATRRRSSAAEAAGAGGTLSLASASGGGSTAERSFTPSEVDLGMQATTLSGTAVPASRLPSYVTPPPP
jgi:hypothetical protein